MGGAVALAMGRGEQEQSNRAPANPTLDFQAGIQLDVVIVWLPNGLELCCPAARATLHPFSRILAGCTGGLFARQPGQHQRGVRRHELEPRRRQARCESTSAFHPGAGRRRPLPAPAQATQLRPETSAGSPYLAGRFGRTNFAGAPPRAAMPAGGETQAVTLARPPIASPDGGSVGDDRGHYATPMTGTASPGTRAETLSDTTRADLRDKEPHRTAGRHHRQAGDLGKGAASRRLTASSYAARRLRQATVHSRATWQARHHCILARQPGQHQRVVRRRRSGTASVRTDDAQGKQLIRVS